MDSDRSPEPQGRKLLRDAAPSLNFLLEMEAELCSLEPLLVVMRPGADRHRASQVFLPVRDRLILSELLKCVDYPALLARLAGLVAAQPGPVNPATTPAPATQTDTSRTDRPQTDTPDAARQADLDTPRLTPLMRLILDCLEREPGNRPLTSKAVAARLNRKESGTIRAYLRQLSDRGLIDETDDGHRFMALIRGEGEESKTV